MYARIAAIVKYAESNPSRPLIMCEYAHVMGNSGGNLQDYWDVINRYPVLQGGFIWEWADQGLLYTSKRGVKYMAYGHDYHPDLPTDGAFINKGLVNGIRQPIPHYYEVKKVYQPVKFHPVDLANGIFELENRYVFANTDHLNIDWIITANGQICNKGTVGSMVVEPGQRKKIQVRLPDIARMIAASFANQEQMQIPGSYVEFAERKILPQFAAGLSRQPFGSVMHSERVHHRMMEQWHPLGIVGIISAFNFPAAVWGWNAIISWLCGNVSIWKLSEKVPLTALACQNIVSIG